MKNVYVREGGYWFSKMSKGKRTWVNLQTRDLSEAVKRATEIRSHPLVKPTHDLMDDARRFLEYKVRMNRHTSVSSKGKLLVLQRFCNWLPESATLANITSKQASEFYAHLQRSITKREKTVLSESTILSYMMTLRAFFRWAVEVERVRVDNPVKAVKFAVCDKRARLNWCSQTLKTKLIAKAPNVGLRFILFCGFDAGLRRGEIVEARRDWFDLKAGLLHVRKAEGPPRLRDGELPFRSKDRDERTIPLTKPFQKFLGKFLRGRDTLDFALEPTVKHGDWRYRYDFRRPFTEYMTARKCEWITPHVMRHSFASILASAGVSIFKIAQWLGDDVRVVQRHYAKLASGDEDIHALTSSG